MTSKAFYLFVSIILTITFGCNWPSSTKEYILTSAEKTICDTLQIDTSIIKAIRQYNTNPVEPFHYAFGKFMDKDGTIKSDSIFLKGLLLKEPNATSYELVFSLKDNLRAKRYTIFILENNFGINNEPDHIGILKTTDKYAILKQIKTNGINWGITNDSLISIIKTFDEAYSLELVGASGDWCDFVIHGEPQNWTLFAREVYKICPDIIGQGIGSVQALAAEMKKSKRLYLWWD